MNAGELYDEACRIRERESLLDVAPIITVGKRSFLLWLSKGQVKRLAKKLLRKQGVVEGFLRIRANGDGRWRCDILPSPHTSELRAAHLLWICGAAQRRWENGLH